VERLLAGHIAHGDYPLRAAEVFLVKRLQVRTLSDEVPDRKLDLELLARIALRREPDPLEADLAPERRDVPILERVLDVPPDQRGLADGGLADHTDFGLEDACQVQGSRTLPRDV